VIDDHPNAARVRAFFHAFHERDLAAIRDAIAEDAVWHFPGENLLAGSHQGHAGIFAFLARVGQLTEGSFALTLEDVVANDHIAVAFFHGSGRRAGLTLENPTCLKIRLEHGRAVELHEFVWDQQHVDQFWTALPTTD
jgi:ketosteroid isomerase-like protein